ncbi:MAG: hypothetical protein PHO41_06690 [Eubacteriales bacterium]|nr:hypothetical protein [Eubacteriales bacterium]
MSNESETAVEIKEPKEVKAEAKQEKEEKTDLDVIIKYQKKLLGQSRIRTLACVVIAAVFVLAALVVWPKVDNILGNLQVTMSNLNTLSTQLNEADVPGLMEEVQALVTQGQVGISQALLAVDSSMEELASLDIESLNAAIKDFAAVSKGLANSPLFKILS